MIRSAGLLIGTCKMASELVPRGLRRWRSSVRHCSPMLRKAGLAKVTTLDDEHHIMRFVPYAKCEKDADDNVIGFLPTAFEHRVQEGIVEEYLSAAWVEFFD